MKNTIRLLAGVAFFAVAIASVSNAEAADDRRPALPFNVYTDASAVDNHFAPSGWMGDYGDLTLNQEYSEFPHSGASCIKISYSGKMSDSQRWAGIFWQNPPNNWGDQDGGYDLSQAKQLVFYARGEKGGETIHSFGVGGIDSTYSDSSKSAIGPARLTPAWKKYTVDLTGKDLSYIIGGFMFSLNVDGNPSGATFYLDDIRFE